MNYIPRKLKQDITTEAARLAEAVSAQFGVTLHEHEIPDVIDERLHPVVFLMRCNEICIEKLKAQARQGPPLTVGREEAKEIVEQIAVSCDLDLNLDEVGDPVGERMSAAGLVVRTMDVAMRKLSEAGRA